MSILNQLASGQTTVLESVEPEIVSESDMACLITAALEDTCTDEELDELVESVKAGTLVLTPVEERSIVKLDKKAKKEQAYRVALYQVAREHDDANYKQLVTLWKAEKVLTAKIEKKYHSKAVSRMKQSAKEAKNSKSDKVKKAGQRTDALTKSQRMTQRALSGNVKMDPKVKSQTNSIINKLRPR